MTDPGAVLVVCTGNVCRSPYIEHLLRAQLGDLGVSVSSAGTLALAGEPMQDGSAELLARDGIDADGFVARQLTAVMVEQADLVLTATREHRSEVVRSAPRGLRYTFALADFSDLVAGAQNPPSPWDSSLSSSSATPSALAMSLSSSSSSSSDEGAVARLVALASSRRGEVEARTNPESAIDDPFRQGPEAYARMADQIEQVLPQIVSALRHEAQTA